MIKQEQELNTSEINTSEIIDAYENNLNKIKSVQELHIKIRRLFDKMQGEDIPNIVKIYGLVFKNIYPDKKYVCDVDSCNSDGYSYNDDKPSTSQKRKLFLNRDGFSFSNSFNRLDKNVDVDISRTNYLTSYNQKGFIKMLKRLFKDKQKIIDAVPKDYKKTIVIRFFEAFDKSECDKVFDYDTDYDYFKITLPNSILIRFYNQHQLDTVDVNFLSCKGAGNSVSVSKGTGWNHSNNIELDDLEKISQIYKETMAFLNEYYEHLDIQDKSLLKFYNMLRDSFAKEMILDSLKDKKQDVK